MGKDYKIDLAIIINLVVLEHSKFNLPMLVFNLLGSQLCTLCLGSEVVLRRGRRRITRLPRRLNTSIGRLNLLCSSTTRLMIMARSIVLDVNALLKNVVLESSWLLILTVSTVESVVSPMCLTSPRTSKQLSIF